jgi:hypothetical protein
MIPYLDISKDYLNYKKFIIKSMDRLHSKGRFIQGEEIKTLEKKLQDYLKVKYDGMTLKDIDFNERTESLCMAAFNQNPLAFQFIPEIIMSYDMCLKAVTFNKKLFKFVPKFYKQYELSNIAVSDDGLLLKDVVINNMSKENYINLVEIAVQKNGCALQHVPQELRKYDICLKAVSSDGRALQYVPKELMKHEICLKAVSSDGRALKYVPQELMKYDICFKAVSSDGLSLQYVPQELMNEGAKTWLLCFEAVENNPSALQYVPIEHKTFEMCQKALSSDFKGTKIYVPKELLNSQAFQNILYNAEQSSIKKQNYKEALKNLDREY